MECEEWGGHLELSKIYLTDSSFYINYQRFSADCNSIKENDGEPIQTLVTSITKKLSNRDLNLVQSYIHGLMDANFEDSKLALMHSGYVFEVTTAGKGIKLHVYTSTGKIIDEYLGLIRKLIK